MNLVVIESPFAPPKDDPRPEITLQRNVAYCRASMRMAFMEGFAPYASHGLYTLPGVLIDTIPDERRLGMKGGFSWGRVSECKMRWMMMDFGKSSGMVAGEKEAQKCGQEVVERTLPGFADRWTRSVLIFDVMKEALARPIPPALLVHLEGDIFDLIESWALNTQIAEIPEYIHQWNRNPESALPACFRF